MAPTLRAPPKKKATTSSTTPTASRPTPSTRRSSTTPRHGSWSSVENLNHVRNLSDSDRDPSKDAPKVAAGKPALHFGPLCGHARLDRRIALKRVDGHPPIPDELHEHRPVVDPVRAHIRMLPAELLAGCPQPPRDEAALERLPPFERDDVGGSHQNLIGSRDPNTKRPPDGRLFTEPRRVRQDLLLPL